jgi:ribosomal protein S18 acetylase RimI-like enzyme
VLRYADLRDLRALERLEALCFREHRYRPEFLRWILENPRAATLVWAEDGDVTGSVMILLETGQSRILSIAVHPERRRRGIGARLLAAAERVSLERGATVARLEVSTTNDAAIAMYRSHGYRADGVLPRYYSWGEDAFAMRKQLDANS